MKPYAIQCFGPNLTVGAHSNHIHGAGCRDALRYGPGRPEGGDSNAILRRIGDCVEPIITVSHVKEIVHYLYPPECFCYDAETEWKEYAGDIKVFPCVGPIPWN